MNIKSLPNGNFIILAIVTKEKKIKKTEYAIALTIKKVGGSYSLALPIKNLCGLNKSLPVSPIPFPLTPQFLAQ